ncbi:FecR domain-containing protein [Elusimicrobiota bacterium]
MLSQKQPNERHSAIFFLFSFLLPILIPADASAAAKIADFSGHVRVQQAGKKEMRVVRASPFPLGSGDLVRTGPGAKAVILLDGGSRLELGAEAHFVLEKSSPKETQTFLKWGLLRSWIKKMGYRGFTVRTPTAVCSVRGTEFRVQARMNGMTSVDLFKGLLDVTDKRGKTFTLQPGQRIETDYMGARGGGPQKAKLHRRAPPRTSLQSNARHEVGLDMKKEAVLAAAARELKLAEYQQGKSMIDVHGKRVRLEEYILRPEPNQFKLVILNERADRFDYFYYHGTFNKQLPTDLSVALAQLGGTLDATPEYYLTGFETGRSNTQDSIREVALDGHPVDVNNNVDQDDNITSFFDPDQDSYVDVTGRDVYQTIFDRYGFYVNGILKYGWDDNGGPLTSYENRVWATNVDPISGAALGVALPIRSVASSFPSADRVHQNIFESYSDGTSITWDNYIINDEGEIASTDDFAGVTSGSDFRERILGWNYEQVVTATEFNGRRIDLVVEPRILIRSGLMQ